MMFVFTLDKFMKDKDHSNMTSAMAHSSIDSPFIFIFHQFIKTINLSNVKLALLLMANSITLQDILQELMKAKIKSESSVILQYWL